MAEQKKQAKAEIVSSSKKQAKEGYTRVILNVKTESLESLTSLKDLTGKGRGELLGDAIDKLVEENKTLIEQFVKLRASVK